MKKTIFIVIVLLTTPFLFTQGWSPPTEDPPSSDVGTPIQEGGETQTKSGGLNILDSLGVGTEDPEGTFEAVGNSMISTGDSYEYVYEGSVSGHQKPRCNEESTNNMTCDQSTEDEECSTLKNYSITDSDPSTCYDNYTISFLGYETERSNVFEKRKITEDGNLTVEGDLDISGDLLQDGEDFDMGEVTDSFRFLTRIGDPDSHKVHCEDEERAIHGGCPVGDGHLIGDSGFECDESGNAHVLCVGFDAETEDTGDIYWLHGGNHLNTDCEDEGGEVVTVEDGVDICRFGVQEGGYTDGDYDSEFSCPSGWDQYNNWSTTVSVTCQETYAGVKDCTPCTTDSHYWKNKDQETCRYTRTDPFGCNIRSTCKAAVAETGCY